jgi:hypothetical protein
VECPLCSEVYKNLVDPPKECIGITYYTIYLTSGKKTKYGHCILEDIDRNIMHNDIHESFDLVEITYKGESSITFSFGK